MKVQNLVLLFIATLFVFNLMAAPETDSLLIELRSTPANKEKTLLLNDLSKTFKETNIDSSVYYAKKGYELASEIDFEKGIAENAASLADYYVILDSLNKAKEFYTIAVKYFEYLGMDFDVAQVNMVIGNIFLSQNSYSQALDYYHRSQIISEKNNFEEILPSIYNNIGIIYNNLDEKDKALKFFKKAYKGFKNLGSNENMAYAVSNIADIYLKNSRDSLAISYYNEALKIFKETGNMVDAASIYNELGNYEFNKGDYKKALTYYQKGLELIQKQKGNYLGPKSRILVSILANLGRVHSRLGNMEKAKEYLQRALKLGKQNHYSKWIEFSSFELSKIYENEGNFGKALDYYKMYEQYGDTILNESSIKKLTQLEMQFEFDKKMKEKELEAARKESEQQKKEFIYIIFTGLGIFIAIIAILLFINQKSKTIKIQLKNQNLRLEREKLQQELDYKNKELATNVMYLLNKNEFITSTAEKLKKSKLNFKKENQKLIQDIIRDMLLNSSTDVWKEFEMRFQEVHSDFYENLNKKFPDLTPNEKKICAFLRLNMSTKDISAITYQSVRSIDMARFRLRKKMKLDSDENLINYLSQF